MYLVVLYIFIRWKGRVTIIVTITFLRIYAIVGLLWIIKHRNATNEFGYFIQGSKS